MTFLLAEKVNRWFNESTAARTESSIQPGVLGKSKRDWGRSRMPNPIVLKKKKKKHYTNNLYSQIAITFM